MSEPGGESQAGRPVIGITSRHARADWIARNVQRYVDAVRAAGGEPVIVAPETHASEAIAELDGLLLSGGADVDPAEYGAPLDGSEDIDPARDALELAMARAALEQDLPVLGICRGLQVLNVACGGGLVQDVPGHRGELIAPERRADTPHAVEIEPASRLGGLLGSGEITVNSFHHQIVTPACLGSGLVVSARHGEVVEAVEAPGRRFVLGVQWHPERYPIDAHVFSASSEQARLFEAFVRAAAERREVESREAGPREAGPREAERRAADGDGAEPGGE
jgi:anthranilate synthase component 2/putative glutamine amidotransferase